MRLFIAVILASIGLLAGCGKCHDKTCTTTTEAVCPPGTTQDGDQCFISPVCENGSDPVEGKCTIPWTCEDGSEPACTVPWTCPDNSQSIDGKCRIPWTCTDGKAPVEGKCYIGPTCPPPYVTRDGECTYPYCKANDQVNTCFCNPGHVLTPGTKDLYYCCNKPFISIAKTIVPNCVQCPADQKDMNGVCVCKDETKVVNPCTNTCEVPK